MADPEHLEQLEHGVEEWNQWREEHLDIEPDLSFLDLRDTSLSHIHLNGANLSNANLRFAKLRGVKLSSTNLSNADFDTANLSDANLSGANLSHVNFSDANLSDANLSHADLSGVYLGGVDLNNANLNNADLSDADLPFAKLNNANLSYANLSYADLSGAKLNNAKLSNVTLDFTIFADIDLRSVKGLVEIKHSGPSIVELHSIQLPEDGSALHFLRGVGVPDEWIELYRTTMMHPIQYYSCFLSYSSTDEGIAKRLHADLQANGVRCWFAPHNLKPGDYMRKEIDQAIHLQDKLLLILSESAINSGWVDYEVEIALAREREQKREILFPLRLDETVLQSTTGWAATLRRTRHIGDFANWTDPQIYQQTFDRLLRDLKKADV